MHAIGVSILSESPERLAILQQRIESTQLGRVVFTHSTFPVNASDPAIRRMQDLRTEIVLVDIGSHQTGRAMQAIEFIHANVANASVFAAGVMNDPTVIVSAMRAGAREYLERDAAAESFSDALRRFAATTAKARASSGRARILAVANAKGGAGATTVAVNTAVALSSRTARQSWLMLACSAMQRCI